MISEGHMGRMWEKTVLAALKVLSEIRLGGINETTKSSVRLVCVAAEIRKGEPPEFMSQAVKPRVCC